MARFTPILLTGLLLAALGCRSTAGSSSAIASKPFAGNLSAGSKTHVAPPTPKPAVALYIPGKEGSDNAAPAVAPPATLAFGGDPKAPLPEVPSLPPLPVGDPGKATPPPAPPVSLPPLPPITPPSVPTLPPASTPSIPPPPAGVTPPVPTIMPPTPAPPAPTIPAPTPPGLSPPPVTPPSAGVGAEGEMASLVGLHARAVKQFATIDSYIMRLKRREVVNGKPRPEEIMLCKIRKEPFSAYFKWLGDEGKGREVVYVKGHHGNLIHSLTATGDVLFLPGGNRFKVAPDSFLVKSKSRHPITEAGVGSMITRFGHIVESLEKGDSRLGTLKYLGELKRPEFENRVVGAQQTLPPKCDPHLPRGGQRLWFFDATHGLPVLVIATDENGREAEYYCHDRFIFPANLREEDFNPDLLWKSGS